MSCHLSCLHPRLVTLTFSSMLEYINIEDNSVFADRGYDSRRRIDHIYEIHRSDVC